MLLLLIFNVFDTIGKYLSAYQFYGKYFCTSVVLFRYSYNPLIATPIPMPSKPLISHSRFPFSHFPPRFVFFGTFILQCTPTISSPAISSDLFCLLNMALFALTNGYATGINMTLAPQVVDEEEKETSGFMMSFPLTFGILVGCFLALLFVNLGA